MNRKTAKVAGAALLLVISTAACGSDGEATAGAGTGDSTEPADGAEEPFELAFVQGVAGEAFYITMQCGIEAEAEAQGATVTTQGPQKFDPTMQTPVVQSVVASKPDALLIAPTDVAAMQQPIAQAKEQGIKVVLVDTTLEDPSVAESAISSDNLGGGKAAFEAIQQLVPDGGKLLGVGTQPGVSTTDARDKGFAEAAEADAKFEYLGVQYSQNEPAKAASIVSAALQKDPDIVGIFASNLGSAQGAATGIRQAGKSGKVTVIGFDAGSDQIKALKDGTVQALIAQQPAEIGKLGVQQAIKALNGEATEKEIGTGFTILTKDNVDAEEGKAAAYKDSC
jgi:ribose transport system substrate-binding protein